MASDGERDLPAGNRGHHADAPTDIPPRGWKDTTTGRDEPMGERGAVKADTVARSTN